MVKTEIGYIAVLKNDHTQALYENKSRYGTQVNIRSLEFATVSHDHSNLYRIIAYYNQKHVEQKEFDIVEMKRTTAVEVELI